MSPSASVSPSPSQEIYGIETDIIAIKQVNNLTVIVTPNTEITIRKSVDEITIRDVEDVLSGTSALDVEITAIKQSDDIVVTRPTSTDIVIID